MDPWKSWAIVGIAGAGAAYYYSQSGKHKKGRGLTSSILGDPSQRRGTASRSDSKDTRKKKSKGKASDASDQVSSDLAETSPVIEKTSSTVNAKKRKGGKQEPSKLTQSSAVDVSSIPDVDPTADDVEDEEMSNREFAMQLSELKTGTSLKKPDTADKENKKTKKQGKSTEMPPEATNGGVREPNGILHASTASSTTGADADDDLSVSMSPEIGAIQATTSSGADVSDMLETPVKGPSVLRLTEPTNQQPTRQPQPQKLKPEPETKKQRQNRRKNEEKKAMREQAEKERRVLLERQLRTAREAEGRPAKNGLGISKAPIKPAWDKSADSTVGAAVGSATVPPKGSEGPLLDTFDEDKSFLGDAPQGNGGAPSLSGDEQAVGAASNILTARNMKSSADSRLAGEKAFDNGVPSEEEQIRLMTELESDDNWKTVSKGKGKKRSTTVTSANNNNRPASSGSSKDRSDNDDRTPLSAITNSSFATNHDSSALDAQPSSEVEGVKFSPIAAHSMASKSIRRNENPQTDNASGAGLGRSKDPRIEFPHLDFEGGRFQQEDINDKGVSKYFMGKLLPNGKPDYNDPDYVRNWVPGMSVHQIYRPRRKHPGFREDGVTVKETFETIDHTVWTRENIQDHPDYDPAFPCALTGHPMDSDWLGDWDSSDMEEANSQRAKQQDAKKAERRSLGKKESEAENEPTNNY